jgi:hypothetical protein
MGILPGMQRLNHLFKKLIPTTEAQYHELVNRLRPFQVTFEEFLPNRDRWEEA